MSYVKPQLKGNVISASLHEELLLQPRGIAPALQGGWNTHVQVFLCTWALGYWEADGWTSEICESFLKRERLSAAFN